MRTQARLYLTLVAAAGLGAWWGPRAAHAQGACCFSEGVCEPAADEETCGGLGGVFLPGADCADDPCGTGACCAGPSCVMTDAYTCLIGGREFMGAGTDCVSDPCGFGVGACCLDGVCDVMSPEDCASIGGTWLIAGSNCVNDPCALGACCVPGDCLDSVRYECDALGGAFFAGALCADDPCEVPNDCPLDSLYSQSRDDPDYFVAFTSELSAGYVRSDNFWGVPGPIDSVVWWGLELSWNFGWVECTETDPTFEISLRADDGGVPGATVCTYTVTAARVPTGIEYLGVELNEYSATLPQPCVLVNGWISIVGLGDPSCWFLWMSSHDGDRLSYCEGCQEPFDDLDHTFCLIGSAGGVFGACCDDLTGTCVDGAEITTCLGPDQRFAPDGLCADFDPECGVQVGACCFADGSCLPLLPEADCQAADGNWLGPHTNCVGDPCTPGACCVPEGCFEAIRIECAPVSNIFYPWIGCTPDPCAPGDCPLDSLYGQSPDDPWGFTAYTSESAVGYRRLEDFSGVAGPIEEVLWWGFDLQWLGDSWAECEESDNTFDISFHEDAGGWPGPVVCSYTLTATRMPTGVLYLGAELNAYSVTLPQACVLVNGWISIVGRGDPDCWFLWMSSGDGSGLSYCDGCYVEWESDDLSFCLLGSVGGVFGACCDETTGICTEDVEITTCLGADQLFAPGAVCDDFDPPCGVITGACCRADGGCSLETEEDCLAAAGNWLGGHTLCDYCPCVTPCPPEGVAEGEPVCYDGYIDEFNGGCDAETQAFSPISLCETVCGRSGVFYNGVEPVADYDWYEIQLDSSTQLTWTVEAEFPVGAWIVDGNAGCAGATVLAANGGFECIPVSTSFPVGAGTYWLVVGPTAASDLAECGAHYTARATSATPCFGDLDGDGDVDPDDFTIFAGCMTGPDSGGVPLPCVDADNDQDEDVDMGDFRSFQEAFTG